MAVVTTNVLSMTFSTNTGESTTIRISEFNPEIDSERVGVLMNTIITNGSIFKKVPVLAKSAKIVATTTTDVDLDI